MDVPLHRINERWALAADQLQWVLQHRQGVDKRSGKEVWSGVLFVSSTKAILARCMREKGVPAEDAEPVLAGLPETFQEWSRASWETVSAPPLVPVAPAASIAPKTEAVDG
jgi:hypothetical protein